MEQEKRLARERASIILQVRSGALTAAEGAERLGTATLETLTIFLIRANGIRPAYRNEADIFLEKFFRHLSIEQSRPLHGRFLASSLPVPLSL